MRTGQPSMHVPHIKNHPIDDVAGFPRFWPNFTPLARPSEPLPTHSLPNITRLETDLGNKFRGWKPTSETIPRLETDDAQYPQYFFGGKKHNRQCRD
jgi:hypothetical protein